MAEKELAAKVANELDILGFKRKLFCSQMASEHRYTQGQFTRLCLEWLATAATQYQVGAYDDRNEDECKIASICVDALNKFERRI